MLRQSHACELILVLGWIFTGASCSLDLMPGRATTSGPNGREEITVKVRNGKTGLPIWLASPYVYVGKINPEDFVKSHRRTKFWGDAHVDVTGALPQTVKVEVDFIDRDCRISASAKEFQSFDSNDKNTQDGVYDIGVIRSTGIVAHNFCSGKTQRPEPGVLMIFVIPSSFKEIWYE